MQKIKTKLLLYSRTGVKDYRWIYIDDAISFRDAYNIRQDFLTAFKKYSCGTGNPSHIFIRRLDNGLAFYRVQKTRRIDNGGRNIYTLLGFSVSMPDLLYFCSQIHILSFDLLKNNKIKVEKLKESDERLVLDFDYIFNEKADIEMSADRDLAPIISQKIGSFIERYGWGNGFHLMETASSLEISGLQEYEQEPLGQGAVNAEQNATTQPKKGFWAKISEFFS